MRRFGDAADAWIDGVLVRWGTPTAAPPAPTATTSVKISNQRLEAVTRSIDDVAMMALWADDGVSLLPDADPMVGKAEIGAFLKRVTRPLQGARMTTFEMKCTGIDVVGDMATEWCCEHQVVQIPGAEKPFDGRERMLLVLRRGTDGVWLLEREMWVSA